MKDVEITPLDARTITIRRILDSHQCRFVLDGQQIRLDGVEWAADRTPVDAEDVLDEMWGHAVRYRASEQRA